MGNPYQPTNIKGCLSGVQRHTVDQKGLANDSFVSQIILYTKNKYVLDAVFDIFRPSSPKVRNNIFSSSPSWHHHAGLENVDKSSIIKKQKKHSFEKTSSCKVNLKRYSYEIYKWKSALFITIETFEKKHKLLRHLETNWWQFLRPPIYL